MSEAKEPRTAIPGTLLSQWWTLGSIALDSRTAGRHTTVAWVIIDRYMQSKGGSRASLRYIETATGLSRPTVIGACRELVEWGYFSRHLGAGTRPTEYAPNWLVVKTGLPLASGQQGFTAGGQQGFTTTDASGEQGFTKDLLTSPADKPADSKVGNENTHAAPTAPPAPTANAADAAETARDPESAFDRFWSHYPRKHQKPKARAAWEKINPDAETAERIIAAAGLWATHYAENPVDKKWMPAPANWLAGERYDEDLPSVYVDAKEAAIAKAKGRPKKKAADIGVAEADNDNHMEDAPPFGYAASGTAPLRKEDGSIDFTVYPDVERWVTITSVEPDDIEDDNSKCLTVYYTTDCGIKSNVFIITESDDATEQEDGQRVLSGLHCAAGLVQIETVEELVGSRAKLLLHYHNGGFVRSLQPHEYDDDNTDILDQPRWFEGPNIDYDWKPPPRVERPRVKFVPRFSVVPKAEKEAREMAKEWASKFNDEMGDAA